jgi:hypothetical protein
MSAPYRKAFGFLFFFVMVAVSFAFGRWSGTLKGSLEREATYPWALHKKLSNIDARCERFQASPTVGKFFVEPSDGGETLLIAVLNHRTGTVSAFAVDSSGQVASDSWPVECK